MILKGYDNMKKRYIFVIILVFILSGLPYRLYEKIKSSKNILLVNYNAKSNTLTSNNNDLGEIESIIEYGDHSVIAAHYPVFGINSIDQITEGLIFRYINDFRELFKDTSVLDTNYKSELNIDYELFKAPSNIISIKFTIVENMYYYAQPNIKIETLNYDLINEKQVALEDILSGEYLEEISRISRTYFSNSKGYKEYVNTKNFIERTLPKPKNYSRFIFDNDKIIFIFEKNQLFPGAFGYPTVEIPYVLLEPYLKLYFFNSDLRETFQEIETEHATQEKFSDNEAVESLRRIDKSKPMVALTFDDGPYVRSTVPILDTLKDYNVVATFFVLGNRVPNHKEIVQRMAKEGNEIGNHTYSHKQLTTLTPKELKEQINRTQNIIFEVVGDKPKIMRPTYGSYDNKLRSEINMPMILWSIDPQDWKSQNPEEIANHILSRVKDGDIILMHDIFKATADAVEIIIPELINRGFQLVTVSELYESKGRVLQVGNIYSNSYER